MAQHHKATQHRQFRRLNSGGFCLGFAIGGFFDGIVLHQILQWHHLLSGIRPIDSVLDLRFQVLMDGLFHLTHYVVALIGIWLIWKAKNTLGSADASRGLIAWSLIGFGAWHIVDAVVSHWLLQIHRIRMDVDNPLLWDLMWVIPFGVVVLAMGIWMLKTPPKSRGPFGGGAPLASVLCALAVTTGLVAAVPPAGLPDDDRTLVVFRPGLSFAAIESAASAMGGQLVWTDTRQGVWMIEHDPAISPLNLYRHGALLVSRGGVALGCLSWTTA